MAAVLERFLPPAWFRSIPNSRYNTYDADKKPGLIHHAQRLLVHIFIFPMRERAIIIAKHHSGKRLHQSGGQSDRRVQAFDAPQDTPFICGQCGRTVPILPSGGHHRNHCPYCLYSRHVDAQVSGDRASQCGGLMTPTGYFQRRNGEYVLTHRCIVCGTESFNRIAADDDLPLALSLPLTEARQGEHGARGADAAATAQTTPNE